MNAIQQTLHNLSTDAYSYSQFLINSKAELDSDNPPETPMYVYETASKAARIAWDIFEWVIAILFFPYGIYKLIHLLGGRIIVPAQNDPYFHILRKKIHPSLEGKPQDKFIYDHNGHTRVFNPFSKIVKHQAKILSEGLPEKDLLVAKRISVVANGMTVDAMIMGKKGNLTNGRWELISNGNASTFESMVAFSNSLMVEHIDKLGVNILLYNYPGVASSSGWVTKKNMITSQKAMKRFLEDKTHGIGADLIIPIGISIGGGVQGEALLDHELDDTLKYSFIKYMTFSKVSRIPKSVIDKFLIKFGGWDFHPVRSAEQLENKKIPEIVIQKAKQMENLDADSIEDDGLIHPLSAYAFSLLSEKAKNWVHKKFIGVSIPHFSHKLKQLERDKIIEMISHSLSPSYNGFVTS